MGQTVFSVIPGKQGNLFRQTVKKFHHFLQHFSRNLSGNIFCLFVHAGKSMFVMELHPQLRVNSFTVNC